MATVYINDIFFPSFQFNSRKITLCHSMLKTVDFSWLWISCVSFTCWFLMFLSCCYFFFFFYSCIAATTETTTTITSNIVSKGERTLETNYKLWSSEFQSFGGKKERTAPKLVLLLVLSLRRTHTHTHTRFDCNSRSAPHDATLNTLHFLVHGFWS
jgi:hypothetical protein